MENVSRTSVAVVGWTPFFSFVLQTFTNIVLCSYDVRDVPNQSMCLSTSCTHSRLRR